MNVFYYYQYFKVIYVRGLQYYEGEKRQTILFLFNKKEMREQLRYFTK